MPATPKPRGSKVTAEKKPQRRILKITIGDRTLILEPDKLGPGDDLITRQATGFALLPFVQSEVVFGADSLLILWWTARRKNGEPMLSFAQVLAEYPTYEKLNAAGFNVVEDIEDDPEA